MPFTYFSTSSHPQSPAYATFWLPRAKLDAPPQIQSVTNTSPGPDVRPTSAPTVPPGQCPPFVPTIKTFHDYVGQWESDSEDEILAEDQRVACDKRFDREEAQIERHASRFAAVTPAYGHKVLSQHKALLHRR